MSPKKLFTLLTPIAFFAAVLMFAGWLIVAPKADFSEEENRYLASRPTLSAASWFSGDFSLRAEDYLKEHFPLRTRWITLRTALERLSGHDLVNGVYFSDGRYFAEQPDIDDDLLTRSAESINKFSQKCNNLTVMIAPTSAQIYSDRLPDYAPEPEQRRLTEALFSRLDPGVMSIDLFDPLYRARDDYIYYRTDHHWTSRGAYVAYCELMNRYGYEPVALDKINVEHASHGFLGSYYSKVLSDYAAPDTVDFYFSGSGGVTVRRVLADGSEEVGSEMFMRNYLQKKDKYLSFLGDNVPLVEISGDRDGGSILVIKDSYANCLLPFLTRHFSKVTAVDLRYMMKLSDYVDPADFDRVLILYNAETFAQDRNILKLSEDSGD